MEPDARACRRGGEQVQEAEDVRRRRGDLEAVVGAETERIAPVLRRVPDRAMGVANCLRQTGGAGTEHEDRLVGIGDTVDRGTGTIIGADVVDNCRVVEVCHPAGTEPFGEERRTVAVRDRVGRVASA